MKNMPFVSIVIPAYYSHKTLPDCLTALQAQTFSDFEVIIVNSSQETITSNLITSQFPDIHFYQSPTRLYPHAARNIGIACAKGSFIVLTDPDCIASPTWLETLVACHQTGVEIVGGSHSLASGGLLPTAVHLIKFYWILPNLPSGTRDILPSANVGYSRDVLQQTGELKGAVFCGDAVLAWEAGKLGYPLHFAPSAIIHHHHDDTLKDIITVRYARGHEFIIERITYFEWSTSYLILYLALFWLQPFLVLFRAGKDTWRAGWFRLFVMTLPLQFLGHLAWTLGETRGIIQYLMSNIHRKSS